VKRSWVALGSGLGLSALWRRRGRQRQSGSDPAGELRAKLAENRAGATGVEAPAVPVPEPTADEPIAEPEEASPLDPEVRRRGVHERTRAAMDELGPDDEPG
jgi:hypothetical protein